MHPCQSKLIVYRKDDELRAGFVHCKCWSCEICGPFKMRRLRAIAQAGAPNKFLTLTVDPSHHASPNAAAKALSEAWRMLRKRIARRCNIKALEYLQVVEATAAGWPHFHILMRAPYIPQRWLSAQMRELLRAPIVHIEAIDDARGAANYVTKYISKSPVRFGTLKRFNKSRRWELKAVDDTTEDTVPECRALPSGLGLAAYVDLLKRDGWVPLKSSGCGSTWRAPYPGAVPPLWDCTTARPEFPRRRSQSEQAEPRAPP